MLKFYASLPTVFTRKKESSQFVGQPKKGLSSRETEINFLSKTYNSSSNKVNDDIRYQELEDIKYIRYYSGHQKKVVCLATAPGPEDLFLSGSKDRTLRLWDLRSPHCQGLMKTQGTPIGAFDPEGLIFAAGIDNSTT